MNLANYIVPDNPMMEIAKLRGQLAKADALNTSLREEGDKWERVAKEVLDNFENVVKPQIAAFEREHEQLQNALVRAMEAVKGRSELYDDSGFMAVVLRASKAKKEREEGKQ